MAEDSRDRSKPSPAGAEPTLPSVDRVAKPGHNLYNAATVALTESQAASGGTPVGFARDASVDRDPGRLAVGAKLDRFVILESLGAGGMGVVLAAHDPQLDRKVAIKVLRADLSSAGASRDQLLLREARAMARLSHPNVVGVHEVGTVDDQVFLAMEHIDGQNLTDWLTAKAPGWREIVEVFIAAGRGLAAAHAAGMVHRDFKPANVLLSDDGRVLVTDFGLVSTASSVDLGTSGPARLGTDQLSTTLTQTGTVVGTPIFMAPEQHDGAAVDARADQFGFCAALYLALYGEPPFWADSYPELVDRVKAGKIDEPARASEVPPRLRALLLRGLRTDREQRYAAMEPLLEALSRTLVPRRRWLPVAMAGAVVVAVAGGWLWWRSPESQLCRGAARELAGVWDPAVAAAVEARFAASGRGYAAVSYQHVARRLDDYAAAWVAMREQACADTHIRKVQSDQLLDLRMRCLDRRRSEVAALTALFAEREEPEMVDRAVEAVSQLSPLADCADRARLTAVMPLPADPERRRQIEAEGTRLAQAQALRRAGQFRDSLDLGQQVLQKLGSNYPPLRAEALLLVGQMQRRVGDFEASEAALLDCIAAAAEARSDAIAAEAWMLRIQVLGVDVKRPEEALALRDAAEAALARAGTPPRLEAELLKNLGNVLAFNGKPRDAIPLHQRALAIVEALPEVDPIGVASHLNDLAAANYLDQDYTNARPLFVRALALDRANLGEDHPLVAFPLYNLANVDLSLGRLDDARTEAEQALAINRASLGEDHRSTVNTRRNLSRILLALGDFAGAAAQLEQAQAAMSDADRDTEQGRRQRFDVAGLLERAGELDRAAAGYQEVASAYEAAGQLVEAAQTRQRLAGILARQGHRDQALEMLRASLAAQEKLLEPTNPWLGYPLCDLAELLRGNDQCREAIALYQRGLALWQASYDRDNPLLAYPLAGLGLCRLERGEVRRAVSLLERAVVLLGGEGADPFRAALAQIALARALVAGGGDRGRARMLAQQARDNFARAGAGAAADLAQVDRFLADLAAQ